MATLQLSRTAPEADESDLSEPAAKKLNDLWDRVKSAFTIYHEQIWESFLFYVGQQWVEWDKTRKIFQPSIPSDEWTPQPSINRFAPAIDAVAANFSVVPEVEATPIESLGDEQDARRYGIADVATKLCANFFESNGLRDSSRNRDDVAGLAASLFVLAGAFWTYIRPEKTSETSVPVMAPRPTPTSNCPRCGWYGSGQQASPACPQCGAPTDAGSSEMMAPVLDEMGRPATRAESRCEVRCDVVNPLFLYPRPGAKSMDESPYLIWAERFSLEEIKKRWDYDASPDSERADGYTVMWEQALDFYYVGFGMVGANTKDSALAIQLFVRPEDGGEDFPDGLYAVRVGGKIVHAEPWPFAAQPLAKAGYLKIPTLFFDRSVAFDIVQIQKELRDYNSLIKLHAMVNAATPWIVDENSNASEITGRADKIIYYRSIGPGAQPPHREPAGSLDPAVYTIVEALQQEMEHITGAVNVFRGEQPGSVKAASAIAQLRGQAQAMFSKPVTNWNNAWKEAGRRAVKVMQRYYTLDQISAIVGPERLGAINDFLHCDLDREIDFVSTQNGLPRTRDEKRQEMMTLFDKGALDPSDPNVREKAFELFGETGMLNSFNLDATRARKENHDIRMGGQPRFMPEVEDLGIHAAIHGQQMKNLEFDGWTPEAQKALMAHYLETKQALALKQEQAPPMTPGPAGPPPAAAPAPGAPQ